MKLKWPRGCVARVGCVIEAEGHAKIALLAVGMFFENRARLIGSQINVGGPQRLACGRTHGWGPLLMKKLGYRVVVRDVAKRALAVPEAELSGAKLVTVVAAKSCDVEWMNQPADRSVTLRLKLRPDKRNNVVPLLAPTRNE